MARWEFEQWQAGQAAKEMARNPLGLLIVGVVVTVLASATPHRGSEGKLSAEEYVTRAQYCQGTLSCQESLDNVQQAIKLDPNLAKAYVTRGSLLLKMSHFKEIQPTLRDYEKARSLYQQQNKLEAVQVLDRIVGQVDQGDFITCLPSNPEAIGGCI
jgi:tetratricopeptide (TPR) repeat protein